MLQARQAGRARTPFADQQGGDLPRQRPQYRRLEHQGDRHFDGQSLAQAGHQLDRQHRMAAQLEEIVMHADLGTLQHALPYFGHGLFDGCAWRYVRLMPRKIEIRCRQGAEVDPPMG